MGEAKEKALNWELRKFRYNFAFKEFRETNLVGGQLTFPECDNPPPLSFKLFRISIIPLPRERDPAGSARTQELDPRRK